MLLSQPSIGLLSQSANPALHAPMRQLPLVQSGPPFATEHTMPHAPQLLTLVAVLTSQPSLGLPLQSANPASQWLASAAILVSQPSAGLPLQSANPALQLPMPQMPAAHTGVSWIAAHA